jgi:(E)-4-hydroxy-3-methylbut-2-enyl-diphosphate synthase
MKSSNVKVMVQSTRLLAQRMQAEGMSFPIHLGVTEAGDGEDGIIKSAAGIGALLEEGIGDTIRVSLTGAPEIEIPVAIAIVGRYNQSRMLKNAADLYLFDQNLKTFANLKTIAVSGIGGNFPIGVIAEKDGIAGLTDERGNFTNGIKTQDFQNLDIINGNASEARLQIKNLEPGNTHPLVLKNSYSTDNLLRFQVDSAIDIGSLLIDGIGDAIWPVAPDFPAETVNQTAFAILQATRARITRTEFISCPSCGRTLFDLERTLQEVKAATKHLKGLKIAVMGCIVNGPGEMADADYGYVGAGPGKVTLYKGKEIAHKNILQSEAIPQLISLIKESGDWKETELTIE